MICSNCQGGLEPIMRAGQPAFNFCRHCKLPHDEKGRPLFSSKQLKSQFNPLQIARDTIKKSNPDVAPITRVALETALMQALFESYTNGLKDGVLLAYSQDVTDGEPYEQSVPTVQGASNPS